MSEFSKSPLPLRVFVHLSPLTFRIYDSVSCFRQVKTFCCNKHKQSQNIANNFRDCFTLSEDFMRIRKVHISILISLGKQWTTEANIFLSLAFLLVLSPDKHLKQHHDHHDVCDPPTLGHWCLLSGIILMCGVSSLPGDASQPPTPGTRLYWDRSYWDKL